MDTIKELKGKTVSCLKYFHQGKYIILEIYHPSLLSLSFYCIFEQRGMKEERNRRV